MPELVTLSLAALPVEIAGAKSDGKRPTFQIVGYTGAPMSVEGFYSPVIVDLAGLSPAGQQIPALRNHDSNRIVGMTSVIKVGTDVQLSGTITGDNADATEVVTQAKNGFRWQASIGADIVRREFIEAGKKATVNGREVTGPILIARQSTLKEISFVALGADGQTEAAIAALKGTTDMTNTTTNTTDHAAAVTAERERIGAIHTLCGDHPEVATAAIDGGWDVARVKGELFDANQRRTALEALRGSRATPAANYTMRASGHAYGRHAGNEVVHAMGNPRDVLAASCMLMAGADNTAATIFGERLVSGLTRPSGWVDLAARALQLEGRETGGMSQKQILADGFSTTSMPYALGTSIEKTALSVFVDQSSSWRALSRIVPVSTFRAGRAIRLASGTKLEQVGPTGEIKHGTITEDSFPVQAATYARMITVSRADLINDDLGILNDLPMVLGGEAARTVTDTVYTALLAGATTFYSSANGNVQHTALSLDSLATAIATLRTRTDANGRIIGFVPRSLVVPAALEATARQLLNSDTLFRDLATDQQPGGNPLAGLNLLLVVEPRLDATSTNDWYVFSDPYHGAVLAAFLDGVQGVRVESQQAEFDTLGYSWRAYMDFGISLGEYRATVKSDVTPYS